MGWTEKLRNWPAAKLRSRVVFRCVCVWKTAVCRDRGPLHRARQPLGHPAPPIRILGRVVLPISLSKTHTARASRTGPSHSHWPTMHLGVAWGPGLVRCPSGDIGRYPTGAPKLPRRIADTRLPLIVPVEPRPCGLARGTVPLPVACAFMLYVRSRHGRTGSWNGGGPSDAPYAILKDRQIRYTECTS